MLLLALFSGGNPRQTGSRTQVFLFVWLVSYGCTGSLLQHMGSGVVAYRHVGSSQIRDQTRAPCIGRWILNHWTTRGVPYLFVYLFGCTRSCGGTWALRSSLWHAGSIVVVFGI